MASNDIDIRVLVSGEDQLKSLSASLRSLIVSLNDGIKSTAGFDARQRALNQALGNTGRGLNQHAKSVRQAITNQNVLGDELRRTKKDLAGLRNLAAKGFQIKGLNQAITGLKQTQRAMRSIKARAFVSDMRGIGLELRRLGKDAQFVGRSLIVGLTAPLTLFARRAVDAFKALETEQIRLRKITDLKATDAAYTGLTDSVKELSLEFGIQQSLLTGITADFAQLGISVEKAGEVLTGLTDLTGQLTILGDMDVGEAKDLVQTVFLGTQRALEASGRLIGPGEEFADTAERQAFALKSVRGQMYLFNAIENTTALSLQDLATAMPEVSGAARLMGLNFTEAAALLAPMKAAGFDVSESANGIKISLQRMVAPTTKATKEMKRLAEQFDDPALTQAFDDIGSTGIKSIQGLVDVTGALKQQGAEAVLDFYKELFQGRQGPRMATAIMDMAAFQEELRRSGTAANEFKVAIDKAMSGTEIPDLPAIDTIEGLSTIARIATSKAGEEIDSLGRAVTQTDIDTAKMIRENILDDMEAGFLDVENIGSEAGKALMINFLGAANAQAKAQQELEVALGSTSVAIDRIKVAFTNFAAAAVEQFAPYIERLSVFIQDLVDKFEALSPQTKKLMAFGAMAAAALGPLVFIFGQMKLAAGVALETVFKFVPGLSTLSIESVSANSGLRRLNNAITMQGNTVVNTNGRFKTFIATLAGGSGPIGKLADKFGRMTGILSKTDTIGADVSTAMNQMSNNAKKVGMNLGAVTDDMMKAANVEVRGTGFADTQTGKFISQDEVRKRGIPLAKDFDVDPQRKGRMARMFDPLKRAAKGAATMVKTPFVAMRAQFALTRAAGGGMFRSLSAGAFGFVKSLLSVTKVMKILKIAMISTGIGAIIVGIGIAITILVKNFSKIKEAAGPAMEKLQSAFAAVKRIIMAIISPFADLIASFAGAKSAGSGIDALGGAFASVASFIETAALKVEEFVNSYVVPFMYKAMDVIGGVISFIGGIIKAVFQLVDVFRGGGTSIGDVLNTLWNAIKSLAMGILRPFAGPLSALVRAFGFVAEHIVTALEYAINFGITIIQNLYKAYTYVFEGIARGVIYVARIFPMALGAGIRIAGGFIADFISGFAKGIDLIGEGLSFITGGLVGGKSGLSGVAESIRNVANGVGDAISSSMDGMDASVAEFFSNTRNGIDSIANGAKGVVDGFSEAVGGGIDAFADWIAGMAGGSNIKGVGSDLMDALGESVEDEADEVVDPLVDTFGDGGAEAGDKFAEKFKDALKSLQQEFVDLVSKNLGDSIKDASDQLVEALEKQRDAALKVFDDQLDTIGKLEKAEESIMRTREYLADRKRLLDERELNRQNYVRNRALAIYEGRVDDARMLEREELKSRIDAASSLVDLEQKRNDELRKENLDFIKDSIKDAKKAADEFYSEQIEAFKESSKEITKFAPQTIEDYEDQLNSLKDKATEFATQNADEFAKTFTNMKDKIESGMPNKAIAPFSGQLDALVGEAKKKYGLGTSEKSDTNVVGATLQMLHDIDQKIIADTGIKASFSSLTGALTSLMGTENANITSSVQSMLGDMYSDIQGNTNINSEWSILTGNLTTTAQDTETDIKAAMEGTLNGWESLIGLSTAETDFTTLTSAIRDNSVNTVLGEINTIIEDKDPAEQLRKAIDDAEEEIMNKWTGTVGHILSEVDGLAGMMDPMLVEILAAQTAMELLEQSASDTASGIADDFAGIAGSVSGAVDDINAELDDLDERLRQDSPVSRGPNFPRGGGRDTDSGGGSSWWSSLGKAMVTPITAVRANGGRVRKFAAGGYSVPGYNNQGVKAMLHGGEYVINSKAVSNIGMATLESLNNMRFASPRSISGQGAVTTVNKTETTNIYVENFIGEDEWFNSMVKQYDMKVKPVQDRKFGTQDRFYTTYKGASGI